MVTPDGSLEATISLIASPLGGRYVMIEVIGTIESTSSATEIRIPLARRVVSGSLKVLFRGYLDAGGKTQRLLLRINGEDNLYRSFGTINGDLASATAGWGDSGLYLGQNSYFADADIIIDYGISFSRNNKKCGVGVATFAMGTNQITGFECHGVWSNSRDPVNELSMHIDGGGVLGGKLVVYFIEGDWE